MIDQKQHVIAAEGLKVFVIHTSAAQTRDALRAAAHLSGDLDVEIELLVVLEVPYSLSLNNPPVDRNVLAAQLRQLSPPECKHVTIRFCVGRERLQTLSQVLPPESIVMIGGGTSRWSFRIRRLTRELSRLGHNVITASQPSLLIYLNKR